MKKLRSLVLLLVCVFMLSGCIKSRTSMTIDSSKNVKYEVELLVSDALSDGSTESSEALDAAEYEKLGFKVTPIKDNGYSGYKITKDLGNLDSLANNNGEEVSIADILDNEKFDTTKLFKVEKGFLKNTYTANFKYVVDSSGIDMGDDENTTTNETNTTTEEDNTLLPTDDTVQTTETTDTEEGLLPAEETVPTTEALEDETDDSALGGDYAALLSEIEISFTVNLPVKAKTNNAGSVLNDGKTLVWKPSYTATTPTEINFSFEMYNMTNLLIVGGGALAVIVILIIVIAASKKKKASNETLIHKDYDPSIEGKIDETTVQAGVAPVEPTAEVNAAPVETPVQTETPVTPEAPVEAAPAAPAEPVVEEAPGMVMNDVPAAPVETNLEFTLPEEQTANHVDVVEPAPQFMDNNVEVQAPTIDPNGTPDFIKDTEEKTFVVPETPEVAPVQEAPVQNMNGGLDVPPGMALSDIDKPNQQ